MGGLRSELSGGRFRDGALGALAAQLATPAISQVPGEGDLGKAFRTMIAAAVGGAVSESMGGDFGAGELSAAFMWLFNHESEKTHPHDEDYDQTDPNYHYYDEESAICNTDSVCTIDSVAEANRMHPAPGMLSNTEEVTDGQVSNAQIGYKGSEDDFGPVVHTVSSDGLTIRNTTLKGHKLYKGYVERSVLQRGNTIYIRTIGEGVGPLGSLNEAMAKPLWNGLVDGHVRYRVNLGYRK